MRAVPLHLDAGSDVHRSLAELAASHRAEGFVLSVVGNLSQAAFQCPGQAVPTLVRGELEIITLQGTIAPGGVHLHLSLSDGNCQVWGGHLEPGTLVLKGADVLVGLLEESLLAPASAAAQAAAKPPAPAAVPPPQEHLQEQQRSPRVEIVVARGCPYSARALRMLRTLSIPHTVMHTDRGPVPLVSIDGVPIGGYDALADLHGRGALEPLRQP
jgi:predicted DNA-binding protein with PD1-like motif/glutaredoxin